MSETDFLISNSESPADILSSNNDIEPQDPKQTEAKDIEVAYMVVFDEMVKQKDVHNENPHNSTALTASAGRLGDKYYSGDWTLGAVRIGNFAKDQAELIREKGDKKGASIAIDVANLALKLSSNKLIEFSSEDQ